MHIASELNVIESIQLKKAIASDLRQKDKNLSELIRESETKKSHYAGCTDDKETVSEDTPNRNS